MASCKQAALPSSLAQLMQLHSAVFLFAALNVVSAFKTIEGPTLVVLCSEQLPGSFARDSDIKECSHEGRPLHALKPKTYIFGHTVPLCTVSVQHKLNIFSSFVLYEPLSPLAKGCPVMRTKDLDALGPNQRCPVLSGINCERL